MPPSLASLDAKLLKPCSRKLSRLLKLHCRRRPLTIRDLRFRNLRKGAAAGRRGCWRPRSFSSFQLSPRRSRHGEELDKLGELRSMTERERFPAPFPSPITPAYVRIARLRGAGQRAADGAAAGFDEVEEACRSFEKYLVQMVVEEGKVRDLMDVEELLYCWENLKSPVFVDLVSRFYGELCSDLFSGAGAGADQYEQLLEEEDDGCVN